MHFKFLLKYPFEHVISMFKAFSGSSNYNNKILKLLIKKIRELHNLKSKSEFQLFDLEMVIDNDDHEGLEMDKTISKNF